MQPIHVLAVGRIAAGLGPYLAPTVTGPLIGVGGPPEAHLATRLFGGRDVALGLATLTFTGDQRRGVIRAGIVADVLDIAAAGLGLRQKSLPGSQAGLLAALAAGAIVIGARELGTGA